MKYVVVANGALISSQLPKDEAVRMARQWASQGSTTQVFKLEETHYFAPTFQKKAPG